MREPAKGLTCVCVCVRARAHVPGSLPAGCCWWWWSSQLEVFVRVTVASGQREPSRCRKSSRGPPQRPRLERMVPWARVWYRDGRGVGGFGSHPQGLVIVWQQAVQNSEGLQPHIWVNAGHSPGQPGHAGLGRDHDPWLPLSCLFELPVRWPKERTGRQ